MGWLKWREALNPGGRYNRRQFLFWFFVPIILIVLIVTNVWGLEKLLIKLSYYVGLLGLHVGPIATVLAVLAAVFLACVFGLAMIKRCHDLHRSVWWASSMLVPVIGVLFLVYLLFWPGKVRPDEHGIKKLKIIDWLGLGVTISVFSLVILGLLALFQVASPDNKGAPFRVWNRTGQLLNVRVIASDGVVHQGYTAGEVSPGGIIRNEDVLPGRRDFTVKTMNARGDVVYSRDFTSAELAEIDWIVIIPSTPKPN